MTDKDNLLDSKIGGCLLLQKIGQGGMGTVYMARQLSLDRVVALKILSPNFAKDKDKRERFLKEAKSSAKLHHPNIISIHSAGYDGGQCYYTMEYIEGGSVKDIIIKEGKIAESRALEIIYDICQALHHAYQKKLLHRDVKPDNFMITKEGSIKLCDLGLAKIMEDDAHQTQEGMFMGTPYFTSPEQAKGQKDIDIRSDLYSVGASLFNMLTGRYPFEASNPIAVITMHINDPAPLVNSYNSAISKNTVQLVDKLLKKDPKDRFQTPMDVMEAISEILKKNHKKNKSMRISQQMPVPDEIESSGASIYIKPALIGVAAIFIAILGFSLFKGNSKPSTSTTENKIAVESGLGKTFNADKQKFMALLQKPESTSAIKKEKFRELADIYTKAMPEEIRLLEVELIGNLDACGSKLVNLYFDKIKAESDKAITDKRPAFGYRGILTLTDNKLNPGIDDLAKDTRDQYLEKCRLARQNYVNKIVEMYIPVKSGEESNQLTNFRDLLVRSKEFENAIAVINNALLDFSQRGKNKKDIVAEKPIEKLTEDGSAKLPKELSDFSKGLKQNLNEKKFVEAVRSYWRNKDKIKSDQNENLLYLESPETLVAAESIEKVYTDFSRNLRRLGEGETFEVGGVKYVLAKVTADTVQVMDEKNELKEIPFDKLPPQLIQNYTYNLRDFDQNLKLSYGVYTILSGDKGRGNEIIKSVDETVKGKYKNGIELLSK